MTVRILHVADLHLGRTFPQLGDIGPARENDLFDTFERICTEALENEVAAVLIAGDLFDAFAPPAALVVRVQGQLERVMQAGIRILVAPGELDSATYERSIWRREAFAGVHVFLTPTFQTMSFEVDGTTVHVHGIAYDRSVNPEPALTLPTDTEGIHIALLHATIDDPAAPVDAHRYFPVGSAELLASGVSYAALGHHHNRQTISGLNGAIACYPGSPEGLEVDEVGARYVALVELGDATPEVSFLEINRRRIVNATLDVGGCVADEVRERLLEHAGDDVMLNAVLTGTPHEMLDAEELTRAVADSFYWIQTRDETTLSSSPFALLVAGENTIRGYFVDTLQRRLAGTRDAAERATLERALKLGLRSLERSEAA